MIGFLSGQSIHLVPNEMILLVNGVGYELTISLSLYEMAFANPSQELKVWVHTLHKEDQLRLFGFSSESEKSFFRQMIALPGIGPTIGLSMIASLSQEDFLRILENEDISALKNIPGVGKTTAERIVFEYKKKYKNWQKLKESVLVTAPSPSSQAMGDAILGLVALGYKESDARVWVEKQQKISGNENSAEIIRHVLRSMNKTDKK